MSLNATVFKRVKLGPSADGRPAIQYSIQLVDKSLIDEADSFMHKNFLPRNNLGVSIDQRFVKKDIGTSNFFVDVLSKGVSLATILEDDEGNRGPIIGCSILIVENNHPEKPTSIKEDHLEVTDDTKEKHAIMQTLDDVTSKANIFSLYGCSSYIEDVCLAVAQEYEGRGIGLELLKARRDICRLTNTTVSAAVFTGAASQKIATRCGYETLSELDLINYRIDGQIVYPNPEWPVIKWMAIQYTEEKVS